MLESKVNKVTFEEAYYFKLMLASGISDEYEKWLDTHLECEDPLSDITLELSFCRTDVKKTVSVLNDFCYMQKVDEDTVCDRVRKFLKKAYLSGKMSKEDVVSAMNIFAADHDSASCLDFNSWGSMFYLDDYYCLAQEGIISWERFDFAFNSYLINGVPVDSELIWDSDKSEVEKVSAFSKIKNMIKRK